MDIVLQKELIKSKLASEWENCVYTTHEESENTTTQLTLAIAQPLI